MIRLWNRKDYHENVDKLIKLCNCDIQDALKDLLGGSINSMMETEIDEHLGDSKSEIVSHKYYKKFGQYKACSPKRN